MLESFVVRFVPSFCRRQRSFYKTNKQLGATVSLPPEVALRLLPRQIQKHPGSRVLQNNSLSFSKASWCHGYSRSATLYRYSQLYRCALSSSHNRSIFHPSHHHHILQYSLRKLKPFLECRAYLIIVSTISLSLSSTYL